MKKVLIVICISAIFAACNGDSTKSTDVMKDSTSTTVTMDSSKMSSPATGDTSVVVKTDSTTVKKTESTKKK